jgi:acetylornithine deacetylase/succinyl-diaminopimelate desuccinylase-like protein
VGRSCPLSYARRNRSRFLAELKEFLCFPSISSEPQRSSDRRACAEWLANHLRKIGLEDVRLLPPSSHPIVYASWRHAPGRPTILIYGHYDVVPPGPIQEWRTPPFEPRVVGDNLYARGASDDKGQLFTHIKALESYLKTSGRLPVNVKCIFEGEEEIGSPRLLKFIDRNKSPLRANAAVISDTSMLGPGRPAISVSERGALKLEWEVRRPGHELHSGTFGGGVSNPIQALSEMIAKLYDSRRHIAIPGFYENVNFQKMRPYTFYERTTKRPALTLNGITGGHQGTGVKAIIPASALAKLSFRLVPEQNPEEIEQQFRRHIAHITPPGLTSRINTLSSAKPVVIDRHHPVLKVASMAYRLGFGTAPAFIRSGGTIPVASVLGIPTVLMGFGLPDDRIHAPNEKFNIPTFHRAIDTSIWFLAKL